MLLTLNWRISYVRYNDRHNDPVIKKYLDIARHPLILLRILLWSFYWLLLIIVRSPKVWSMRHLPVIVFDYQDGIYSDFFINIYREYKREITNTSPVLLAVSINNPKWHLDARFVRSEFIPYPLLRILNKYVFIAATVVKEQHERTGRSIRMVQVLHGFGSFGTAFGPDIVRGFDRIFLPTPFQFEQLTHAPYTQIINQKNLRKIGFTKIDGPVAPHSQLPRDRDIRAIFYGPTYHQNISSIFQFLDPLVRFADSRDITLYVHLHPLLYKKYNQEFSGGIDWERRMQDLSATYGMVRYIPPNQPFERIRDIFTSVDYFVTDNSGLGYEYCLITGRPVVFLGDKLKVPDKVQSEEVLRKYAHFPEVRYRGIIGPLILTPQTLESSLSVFPETINDYSNAIETFRKEFVFNLGASAPVAALEINALISEIGNLLER